MRIGLVRHFKVKKGLPVKQWITPVELTQWFAEYDQSDVEYKEVDLGDLIWKNCYSSDMPRAVKTAESIYGGGKVIVTKELREIQHPKFEKISTRRMPFIVWALLVRFTWYMNHHAYVENRRAAQKRINSFLNRMELHGEDVLLVCHAGLMIEMRKELVRRGFRGPSFSTAENGRLYIFQK